MNNQHKKGILFVFIYVILTAVQGVWLGSFLQRVDIFATLFINFCITMIFFQIIYIIRGGNFIHLYKRCGLKNIVILNVLTCINWFSYFAAIKFIEPAVEAAIGGAIPAITTMILLHIQGDRQKYNRHNLISVFSIFIGGIMLTIISLKGYSAIGEQSTWSILLGIFMAMVTGVSIASYAVFSKKLNLINISAQEIMVLRFPLLLLITGLIAPDNSLYETIALNWEILFVITIVGVILPIFFLQVGISFSNPLTTSLIITIIPIFFYLVQFLDPRLTQSFESIIGLTIVVGGILYGLLLGKKH